MSSPSQQLHHILQGCLKENRESQKALYDLFYAFSKSICMRYTRDKESALEMIQDGFLKIFTHLEDFNAPEDGESLHLAFKGWVKKIMIYTAIDHYRKHKNEQATVDLGQLSFRLSSAYQQAPDQLAYEELIALVQCLTPAYRAVFNLFVLDGFTHEEIAKKLDISVGTSKSNLAKARENLRQMLKKTYEAFYVK